MNTARSGWEWDSHFRPDYPEDLWEGEAGLLEVVRLHAPRLARWEEVG